MGAAIFVVLAFLAPGSSDGQAPRKPSANQTSGKPLRTPWGDPDLQGSWSNSTIVPLERPDEYKGKASLTNEEMRERFQKHRESLFAKRSGDTGFYSEVWWEWGKDTNRTSLIVDPPDGKLPALTPEAQELAKRRSFATSGGWCTRSGGCEDPTSWLDMDSFDRCITRSLPGAMMPGFYGHYYQILQTPDHVAIRIELIHDVRIIPLRGTRQLGDGIRQWLGDSRGRWEGDTLVVETSNFNDKVKDRNSGGVWGVGSDLRLVERFRRVDADAIDYQFTVTAPATFIRPFTASVPFFRVQEKVMEYACHEGNYAMRHMLSGARAHEPAGQTSTGKR
jgi:hypothetical protein